MGKHPYQYDICLSFAGEDRSIAKKVATALKKLQFDVFYDEFAQLDLWGKDLFNNLFDVYSKQSRLCVILFSGSYRKKAWTNHESKAAQTRVLKQRSEYVLPIVLDDSSLPPEFEGTAWLGWGNYTVQQICEAIANKFGEALQRDGWLNEQQVLQQLNEHAQNQVFVNAFMEIPGYLSL